MKHQTFIEIEVTVDFDFEPEESPVYYPNDSAHPGSPASVCVNSVCFGPYDIQEGLSPSDLEHIESEIMEQINTEDER